MTGLPVNERNGLAAIERSFSFPQVSPKLFQRRSRTILGSRFLLPLLSFACAAFCVSAPRSVFAQDVSAPAVDQFGVSSMTLPNGLKVVVYPKHAVAIAAIDVWVDAGTRRQEPGQEAVAHYLEHVLFTGTPTRPAETDVDGAIEDLGGSLDAATSYDWAHFYTVVPSSSFDGALSVLADVMQHANLSQTAIDSERPIIESEIQGNADDPATSALQTTRAALFGDATTYGQTITGTVAQADAVQRDALLNFYVDNYKPGRVTVVVSGDITPSQVVAAVTKAFGDWKGQLLVTVVPHKSGDQPPSTLPVLTGSDPNSTSDNSGAFNAPLSDYLASTGVVDKTVIHPSPNTFLVFGWPAPSVSSQPDTWVMDVLLTYLGQGGRNVLDDDLHLKQHLVNAVDADYLTQKDPGMLTVTLSLPTANTAEVESDVLAHIQSLRDTQLTDAQLAEAKQQLIASYLFQTETVSGKADSLGYYATINSVGYDENYINNINTVTAQQVQAIAQKYLSVSHYVLTTLGPPTNPENAGLIQPGETARSSGHIGDTAARASVVPGMSR